MEKKSKLVLAVLQGSDSDNTIRNLNEQGFMVTFNYNYDGAPEAETVSVSKNSAVEAPTAPTRDGYTI